MRNYWFRSRITIVWNLVGLKVALDIHVFLTCLFGQIDLVYLLWSQDNLPTIVLGVSNWRLVGVRFALVSFLYLLHLFHLSHVYVVEWKVHLPVCFSNVVFVWSWKHNVLKIVAACSFSFIRWFNKIFLGLK